MASTDTATATVNIIHDPPSAPSSPHYKRTKVIDPSTKGLGVIDMASSTNSQSLPSLQVKLLSAKGRAPTRGSAFAAGYDIYSSQDATVPAHGKAMVETDISIAVPEGTYGRVAPRSGLAAKHSIHTGAGVIDADYRGPVKVILFNLGDADFAISEGDRIAQLIVERIYTPDVVVVDSLPESVRGAGGFGSTGGFAGNPAPAAAAAAAVTAAATNGA